MTCVYRYWNLYTDHNTAFKCIIMPHKYLFKMYIEKTNVVTVCILVVGIYMYVFGTIKCCQDLRILKLQIFILIISTGVWESPLNALYHIFQINTIKGFVLFMKQMYRGNRGPVWRSVVSLRSLKCACFMKFLARLFSSFCLWTLHDMTLMVQ